MYELEICEIEAYKLKGFREFLEERPSSEDFGETLELYRKQLSFDGNLTEEYAKIIRSIQLRHQAILLNNENPICIVESPVFYDLDIIEDFCNKLHSIKSKDAHAKIIELYESYKSHKNIFINCEMQLLSRNLYI